jgi:quercetin dioxygenase-like cupin family protein
MAQPKISLGLVANIWSRQMHFEKAGDVEQGHTHQFDHLSLLAAGSVDITIEGVTTSFTAPHMIYIRADKEHELVATADNTVVYCIHALRDKVTGDILNPASIPKTLDASIAQNLIA